MRVVNGTVETTGIGKPDYSKEISVGQFRPGLYLKYKQTLAVFGIEFSDIASLYPWITGPLAVGATAHLMNFATGIPLPYTINQGYTLDAVQMGHQATEDYRVLGYFDTVFGGNVGYSEGGIVNYLTQIIGWSSSLFDPTAAAAHLLDMTIENMGAGNLQGNVSYFGILTEVGTDPLPTTKKVRCKFCEHITEGVALGATSNVCSECGATTLYVDLNGVRKFS